MITIRTILVIRGHSHIGKCVFKSFTREGKIYSERFRRVTDGSKNLYGKEFAPILLKELNKASLNEVEKEGVKQLTNWNFYDSKDDAAPLLFHLLMKEISNTLFSKEIPKDVMELFEGKSQVVDELIRKEVAGEKSAWFTKYGDSQKLCIHRTKM